jgi:hypothetical protein
MGVREPALRASRAAADRPARPPEHSRRAWAAMCALGTLPWPCARTVLAAVFVARRSSGRAASARRSSGRARSRAPPRRARAGGSPSPAVRTTGVCSLGPRCSACGRRAMLRAHVPRPWSDALGRRVDPVSVEPDAHAQPRVTNFVSRARQKRLRAPHPRRRRRPRLATSARHSSRCYRGIVLAPSPPIALELGETPASDGGGCGGRHT